MAEKIIVAGTIEGEGYDTNLEYNRRVYGTDGIAPACKGTGGGGHETKIIEWGGGLANGERGDENGLLHSGTGRLD